MNTNTDFDRLAATWLADGPTELNDRVLDAALREVHLTSQRRRWTAPWRTSFMSLRLSAAGLAVIIAVAAIVALNLRGTTVGPAGPSTSPTAGPSAAATLPPIDTSSWGIYASAKNWIGIGFPRDWTDEYATRTWTMADAGKGPNSGTDNLFSPGRKITVSAWSIAVEPGTSLETWIAEYCPLSTSPCGDLEARAIPVSGDPKEHRTGLLIPFDANTQAFFMDVDRIWVIAIWNRESDPALVPYGGAQHLLEAFANSVCLSCAYPVGATQRPTAAP